MVPQLTRLKEKGADAIILVVNAPPGAQMMKSRERMGWKAPVVSHWGISGGRFPELAGPTAGDAHFVQTYSFFGKQSPVGERVLAALKKKYPAIKGPEDVVRAGRHRQRLRRDAPARRSRSRRPARPTRDAVRDGARRPEDALRGPDQDLQQPFTAENHDALGPDDYIMVHYEGDKIVPVN